MSSPDSSVAVIANEWSITLPPAFQEAEFSNLLAARINQLIIEDFDQLVLLLYRIDVDEQKLKALLRQFPDQDAGMLIAKMVIERQEQKIQSRKKFSGKPTNPDREESW